MKNKEIKSIEDAHFSIGCIYFHGKGAMKTYKKHPRHQQKTF